MCLGSEIWKDREIFVQVYPKLFFSAFFKQLNQIVEYIIFEYILKKKNYENWARKQDFVESKVEASPNESKRVPNEFQMSSKWVQIFEF